MVRYVLCIDNEGYTVSLELRKVYRALPDPDAEDHGMIRVVDESGEDYLFEADRFVPVEVPAEAQAIFNVEPA